jgi:MGT family glycosyltransferase
MARILFTTWPFPGHVLPHLAIAQALRERGNECAFYTGPRAFKTLDQEGFRYFPFQRVNEEQLFQTLFVERHGYLNWRSVFTLPSIMRRWLLDTLRPQVEDLVPVLEEWKPDVIATDPTMWSPILILHERFGIPVAVAAYFCCMVPGPDAPPFGLGLAPPRTLLGRWRNRCLTRLVHWATTGFRRHASSIRQSYGLPALHVSVTEFAGTMPLYLVPSSPEFDYDRRDLPASVRYVGPCVVQQRNAQTSAWLRQLRRDRPWVHATEGTLHVAEPLVLGATARGLANLQMEVILTTGGNREPEEVNLGPLAPNIHLVKWISHSELFPLTNVVITTGGAGSVLASLGAGVPLIVIPTEWDKPDVAQRVVASGAGLSISPRHCTPRRIRRAVEQVLGDPSFRRNAQRLAEAFGRYGGPRRAAELLEELAHSAKKQTQGI